MGSPLHFLFLLWERTGLRQNLSGGFLHQFLIYVTIPFPCTGVFPRASVHRSPADRASSFQQTHRFSVNEPNPINKLPRSHDDKTKLSLSCRRSRGRQLSSLEQWALYAKNGSPGNEKCARIETKATWSGSVALPPSFISSASCRVRVVRAATKRPP